MINCRGCGVLLDDCDGINGYCIFCFDGPIDLDKLAAGDYIIRGEIDG